MNENKDLKALVCAMTVVLRNNAIGFEEPNIDKMDDVALKKTALYLMNIMLDHTLRLNNSDDTLIVTSNDEDLFTLYTSLHLLSNEADMELVVPKYGKLLKLYTEKGLPLCAEAIIKMLVLGNHEGFRDYIEKNSINDDAETVMVEYASSENIAVYKEYYGLCKKALALARTLKEL